MPKKDWATGKTSDKGIKKKNTNGLHARKTHMKKQVPQMTMRGRKRNYEGNWWAWPRKDLRWRGEQYNLLEKGWKGSRQGVHEAGRVGERLNGRLQKLKTNKKPRSKKKLILEEKAELPM